jgi:MYXO-CTERM domain-containing protein
MNVVRSRTWIAAGLLWACASAQALPLDPIDWVGRRTGGEVCCGFNATQSFHYDASADLFTYSAIGQQTYHSPGLSDQLFQSAFTWTAGIDENGSVTNAGSMQWLGDFGSGFELLATGSVKDVGFEAINPPGGPGNWTFLGMQVLLANSLPGATIDLGREFILNMELVLDMPFDSPFKNDFACEPTCNNYFSDTHVAALRVDEPSTGALALLGLGVLVALRRRQRLLPASQGR